ncbi:low-density lipoprotein receptor-related protein 4-like [Pomacea canaliculata]|uniref:low-density lipoprotein receptor-related protein 4-like n=1 Tax=Pomacea canaliculata TaxID=400727 RepID=UPI000D72BAAD|nr:low-density lipoprotein receptor-related protein 4-like [Pomacea canaliculata]
MVKHPGMAILLLLCMLAVAAVPAQAQSCSQTFTARSGFVSSPSYPNPYPNNQNCTSIICAPEGQRVTIVILTFDTQSGTNGCDRDYVQIRDGSSATSPSLGTYCNKSIPAVFRSAYNCLYIKFVSDSSVSGTGYSAIYTTGFNQQKFLLTANILVGAIHRLDLDTGSNFIIPLSGVQSPVAVDYDYVEDRLYWTDGKEKTINSASLNGSDVRVVRNLGPSAVPDGLAVDQKSRLLVYTDAGNKLIAMMTMSGNKYKTIVNTGLNNPRDVELDKRNGKIYWGDWGVSPKIERCNYDGTGRQVLVSAAQGIGWPNALALDPLGLTVFWGDAQTDKIGMTNVENQTTTVIVSIPSTHIFGMDLYKNNLYVTDWGAAGNLGLTSAIHRIANNGTSAATIGRVLGHLADIVVYAEDSVDRAPTAVL